MRCRLVNYLEHKAKAAGDRLEKLAAGSHRIGMAGSIGLCPLV